MKHAQEPWDRIISPALGKLVIAADGQIILMCSKDGNDWINAERIVECVNAMWGIEDPKRMREMWQICKDLELDQFHLLLANRHKILMAIDECIKGVMHNGPLNDLQKREIAIFKLRMNEYEWKTNAVTSPGK